MEVVAIFTRIMLLVLLPLHEYGSYVSVFGYFEI